MEYALLEDTLKALKLIQESQATSQYDFLDYEFVTPFLLTPLAAHALSCSERISILAQEEIHRYFRSVKFPRCATSAQLDVEKHKSYFPLVHFNRKTAGQDDIIGNIFQHIVHIHELQKNVSIVQAFLCEIVDNIREHAKSRFNVIFCQRYGRRVALSLVDCGIGIPASYHDNGFTIHHDVEALLLTLKGVSTKKEEGRGRGIPSTINWVCRGLKGNIVVVSGEAGFVRLGGDNEFQCFKLDDYGLRFGGTIINIDFEIPEERIDYTAFINKPL